MDGLVTCDTIVSWLQAKYERKEPVSPATFIDSAEKMNILLGDEHARLFSMQQAVAAAKVALLSGDPRPSVAEARLRVEAGDAYREMCVQKAKIERIVEHIRLAKIHARMAGDEAKGYH